MKPIERAPSRPRPLLPAVLVAVLDIFSGAAWSQSPEVLVETAPVKTEAVGETLHAYGVLEPDPDQVLSLSLPHAGLVNRIWVSLGQSIVKTIS